MVHINALTVILYDFIVFNESSPEQIMRKCSLAFFTPKLQGLQSLTSRFFWGNATRSDGLTVMIQMFGYSQNRQSCPSNILKLDSSKNPKRSWLDSWRIPRIGLTLTTIKQSISLKLEDLSAQIHPRRSSNGDPVPISPHLRWRVHPKSCMSFQLSKRCPIHRSARPNHGYSRYRNIIGLQWEYIHGNTNWKYNQQYLSEVIWYYCKAWGGPYIVFHSWPCFDEWPRFPASRLVLSFLSFQFWLTSFLRADPLCFEPSPEVKAKSISSLSPAPSAQLVCFFSPAVRVRKLRPLIFGFVVGYFLWPPASKW